MKNESRPAKAAPDDAHGDCNRERLRSVPIGTAVVLMSSGGFQFVPNLDRFEVGDGELVLTSASGQVGTIPAGDWFGIGTLEVADGVASVALEAVGEAVA